MMQQKTDDPSHQHFPGQGDYDNQMVKKFLKQNMSDKFRVKTPPQFPQHIQTHTINSPLEQGARPLHPEQLGSGIEIDKCLKSLDLISNSLDENKPESFSMFSHATKKGMKKSKPLQDIVLDFASIQEHMYRMTKGRQIKTKLEWKNLENFPPPAKNSNSRAATPEGFKKPHSNERGTSKEAAVYNEDILQIDDFRVCPTIDPDIKGRLRQETSL